jgi:hypothetical protein
MPTEEVVNGYEKILRLESGTLLTVLENARIERHGDAWSKRRVHIPAEFALGESEVAPERRPRRIAVTAPVVLPVLSVTLLIVLLVIVLTRPAAPVPREQQPRESLSSHVRDGSDPKKSGCSLDPNVETLDSMEVDLNGMPVGLIELRYSPQCGVAWPRFEPFPRARIPDTAVIHTDVVRVQPENREHFQDPWVGVPIYGNVLRSTEQCVYAAGRIEIAGHVTQESQTHCYRGRTLDRTYG